MIEENNLRRIRIFTEQKLQRLLLPPNLRILSWRKQIEYFAHYPTASVATVYGGNLPQVVQHDLLEIEDEEGRSYARLHGIQSFRDESIEIEEAEWDGKSLTWKKAEQS